MNIINKVKDFYVDVIDWIEDHPHVMLWSSFAAVVVAAWFR